VPKIGETVHNGNRFAYCVEHTIIVSVVAMMTDAQKIAALGGSASASRKLGVPITTVDTWKRKDRIPPWRVPAVEAALAEMQAA
jgi:hypothetical protein